MVALLPAVRMQTGVPTILEGLVAVQFVIFFSCPPGQDQRWEKH
jgi:hypothetical protein